MLTRHVETRDVAGAYEDEIIDRLLRLEKENPWLWHKMAIQINRPSAAGEARHFATFHWIVQPTSTRGAELNRM